VGLDFSWNVQRKNKVDQSFFFQLFQKVNILFLFESGGRGGCEIFFFTFCYFLLFVIFLLKGEWMAIGSFQKKNILNSSRWEGA
jgi:hypothetical protein